MNSKNFTLKSVANNNAFFLDDASPPPPSATTRARAFSMGIIEDLKGKPPSYDEAVPYREQNEHPPSESRYDPWQQQQHTQKTPWKTIGNSDIYPVISESCTQNPNGYDYGQPAPHRWGHGGGGGGGSSGGHCHRGGRFGTRFRGGKNGGGFVPPPVLLFRAIKQRREESRRASSGGIIGGGSGAGYEKL